MLKRISIRGYKSLSDLDVALKPLSVMFGPNAAGKSNFLDALQLLSMIATKTSLRDAFEPPYRGKPIESFTLNSGGIEGLLERDNVSFTMEADIELSPQVVDSVNRLILNMKPPTRKAPEDDGADDHHFVKETYLRYRITVEIRPKLGILRVSDEYLAALNSAGKVSGKRRPFIERVDDKLHLRMEGQAHPTYYDLHVGRSILSLSHHPPYHPHVVAMREELASWQFFYFEPRERMRAPGPVKEVRHIGMMGEELACFLNTLRASDERQFANVEKALHAIVPSITGIDVSVNNFGEVELLLREGDVPIPARVLSEGTLRILGLLALGGAKEPPSLIGFEEPENGVHPRRIALIADMLQNLAASGSQLILTTHSPLLVNAFPDDSLYVCRKENRSTSIKPFETMGKYYRKQDVERGLQDAEEERLRPSELLMRGDLDA